MSECAACKGLAVQADGYICWDCGGSGKVNKPIRLCECGSLICPDYKPVPYSHFVNCGCCGSPCKPMLHIEGWPICSTCYDEYPMAELERAVMAVKGGPNPLSY